MKVRLEHAFDSDQKTLTLTLEKNPGPTRVVVDQFNYEEITASEMQLIGRLQAGMNYAFEKMWH